MSADPIEAPTLVVKVVAAESSAAEESYLKDVQHAFATHPLEIAAALEAAGCRDVDAQKLGWPDTFALADHLYARQVVDRLAEGEAVIELPDLSNTDPRLAQSDEAMERHLESQMGMRPQWRVLLRGVLFALPGLVLAGALPFPLTTPESALIWITLGLSWGLGQGLAYGGYMRVSLSPGEARRRMVPWVIWHATLMALVTSAVVVSGEIRPLVGLVAFTQALYLIAASGLMVLGREILLYGLLVLGAIAGVHRMIPPLDPDPDPWAAGLAVASMLGASVVLLWSCRPAARSGELANNPVSKPAMVSHIVFGLTSAVLVLWLPWFGDVGIELTFLMTPLVLSLGAIEWLLLWLRKQGLRNLATSGNLSLFKSRSTRALGIAASAYFVCVLIMLSLGLVVLWLIDGEVYVAEHPEVLVAVLALGMYLLFSAVGVALYGLRYVLMASMGAITLLLFAPESVSGRALVAYYGLVCMVLAGVSYFVARRQVRIPATLA